MAEISAKAVKDLREATGAGMMDCKQALNESGGDFDKAVTWLREKGMSSAAKRADRDASEGAVFSYIHMGGKIGVMAEIRDPALEHRAIHAYAAERGIEVIAVGTDLYGTAPVADPVGALGVLSAGDAVLVKGSRVAGLERTAEVLRTTSPDR